MSLPTRAKSRAATAAAALAALLLGAPLLAHAYVGLFTRYMADDYCTAAMLRQAGLLGMQRALYVGWSGRFSFTLAAGLVETLGAGVVPYLPAVMLAAWLAALVWAASQFGLGGTGALLLAELILFVTLDDNTGGVHEALYWQTGSLTYALPLVLLTLIAGGLARLYARGAGRAGRRSLALYGAAAFCAGGFSETYVSMQTAALCAALAVCAWRRRRGDEAARAVARALCAALLGSLLALAAVSAAPGNAARRASLGGSLKAAPSAPHAALLSSFGAAAAFVFEEHNYRGTAHLRLVALLLPLLAAFGASSGTGGGGRTFLLWAIPAAAFAAVAACYAPAFYVMSREPPPRALLVPQFVLASALAAWGYALGGALRRAYEPPARVRVLAAALAAALLLAAAARAASLTLGQAGKARALAAVWDRQDAEMRAAVARGERRLTVHVLYNLGGTDLMTADPKWYVNLCVADYYGAESVRAVPGGEGSRVIFDLER
jgi:hypothetical protein